MQEVHNEHRKILNNLQNKALKNCFLWEIYKIFYWMTGLIYFTKEWTMVVNLVFAYLKKRKKKTKNKVSILLVYFTFLIYAINANITRNVSRVRFGIKLFNSIFSNISAISWRLVLLTEGFGVSSENHWSVVSHRQFYHTMLYQAHLAWAGFELTTLLVIDNDCIYSHNSNYHTITTPDINVLTMFSLN